MSETAEQRSRTMRAVKSRDTKPEMTVRRLLHSMGYRFRLHRKDLPGTPDIVFPGRRKVVFVHGCFWHGHYCARGARVPKENRDYWTGKIGRNRARDARAKNELAAAGWQATTIWECQLAASNSLAAELKFFLNGEPESPQSVAYVS